MESFLHLEQFAGQRREDGRVVYVVRPRRHADIQQGEQVRNLSSG